MKKLKRFMNWEMNDTSEQLYQAKLRQRARRQQQKQKQHRVSSTQLKLTTSSSAVSAHHAITPPPVNISTILSSATSLLLTTAKTNTSASPPSTDYKTVTNQTAPTTNLYFNDHYYNFDTDSTRHISSYKLNEFYEKYRPEVGARTALILGSMLLLIVLYILWKNRCRCFCSGTETSKADEELAYWLSHVENRNKKDEERELTESWPQQLPAASVDAKQATAAWVVEHRKRWSNAYKVYKQPIRHQNQQQNNYLQPPGESGGDHRSRSISQRSFKMNVKQSAQNVPLLNQLMKPFRGSAARNSGHSLVANDIILSAKSKLHLHPNYSSRHSTRLFEELDTNTQLLINYARIGAIDASPVKFNKLTGGLSFASVNHNLTGCASSPSTGGGGGGGGGGQIPSSSTMPFTGGTSAAVSRQPSFKRPVTSRPPNGESVAMNELLRPDCVERTSCGTPVVKRSSAEQDLEALEHGVGANILQNLVTGLVQRRRTSWPRCSSDHLHFFNYTRGVRLLYSRAAATTSHDKTMVIANRHRNHQQLDAVGAVLADGATSPHDVASSYKNNNNNNCSSLNNPSGNVSSSRNF